MQEPKIEITNKIANLEGSLSFQKSMGYDAKMWDSEEDYHAYLDYLRRRIKRLKDQL